NARQLSTAINACFLRSPKAPTPSNAMPETGSQSAAGTMIAELFTVLMVTDPVMLLPAASDPEGCVTEQVGGLPVVVMMLQASCTVPLAVVELIVTVAVPALPLPIVLGEMEPTDTLNPGSSGLYLTMKASRQGFPALHELV